MDDDVMRDTIEDQAKKITRLRVEAAKLVAALEEVLMYARRINRRADARRICHTVLRTLAERKETK